ncbi:MAG: tetratricopeptide repeat protein [Bradymonadaceae bacterium]|nr:tetratricopeptide repeat protein [Lujinxingiaceae bacterium]
METTPHEPLSEDEAAAAAEIGRRFAGGEPLGEILGVVAEYLDEVEHRAYEFYSQGHDEQAATLARGVMALDPQRYFPHLLMGDLALRANQDAQALGHMESAHALSADDPCIMAKLGEAYLRCGRVADGQQMLERVVAVLDDENNAHRRRALVLLAVLAKAVAQAEQG